VDYFRDFFNSCCSKGIPERWKMAVVIPLHKNGDKKKVTQYRPVSNLDAIGKIFERIILKKIDELGEIDGGFQHGFKAHRSTTTAMIEVQDFVATNLDAGNIVGTYSIDLSAAFDVLRPDIFYNQQLKEKIPKNIMAILMDFMSNRKFIVQVNSSQSSIQKLKVGCVQGSILGPRIFTLYMNELSNLTSNAHLVSFADDTYVSVVGKNLNEVKTKIINKMTEHDDFLKQIGMVTNVSKTELIYFARKPLEDYSPIKVKGEIVTPKKNIKVLGVQFQSDLKWDTHIEKVKNKARIVLGKMKFLSKYMDIKSMKKIITSHYFGMLYYASPVWLNEVTSARIWRILNTLHYKGLRTACRDFRKSKSRDELDKLFNRATPNKWMHYSNSKLALQLFALSQNGPPICDKIKQNIGFNDRTKRIITLDTSKLQIGRQSFHNRLTSLREIRFTWNCNMSKDQLRINLKKTFFEKPAIV